MSGEEKKYIEQAFIDNYIVPLGPNVNKFEENMISYMAESGIYAVAMCSGTAAIHIALKLLDVKVGEEIFCSSGTFIATANPILYEKAIPVFIDSEDKTWNICPCSLQKAIDTKKATGKIPRILIVADLFGTSANYNEILEICDKYNIEVVEDAAEALGSKYQGRKCGLFGKFGILSFNGNKIITTSGGGMLLTHSKVEAERAVFLITQARDKAPYFLHSEVGYNYRMSNICAGIGIGQLTALEERVETKRNIFSFYKNNLADLPLVFLEDGPDFFSNRWLSTMLIDSKSSVTPKDLIHTLELANIESRHIWKPLHTQPIFSENEFYSIEKLPISEKIFNEGICLPSGTAMDQETLYNICQVIKSAF
jgi:pyridoxal phosphate-dependent aminotransferase EpsN